MIDTYDKINKSCLCNKLANRKPTNKPLKHMLLI